MHVDGDERSAAVVVIVMLVDGDVERPVGLIVGPRPDLRDVETLARLQLAAKRLGCTVRLRGAGPHLRGLLEFVGLPALAEGDDGDTG